MPGIVQVKDSRLTVTWDSPSTYTHFSLRIGLIILTIMWSTMRTLSGGCGDEIDDGGGDVSDDDDEIMVVMMTNKVQSNAKN